jgi:hypothetical protein
MNKNIAIQANKHGFRALETFVEELSDSLQLEHTYYGNIMTSLSLMHELACEQAAESNMVVFFEAGHQGLMFDVTVESKEKTCLVPGESANLLLEKLTDRIAFDSAKNHFSLFFDTKSVFSLMAKKRAESLKTYLKGATEKISKHNDFLQSP